MNKIKQILKLPLFKGVNSDVLEKCGVLQNCMVTNYKKGAVIHLKNERCTCLDIIMSGIVSVQALEATGNMMTVASFGGGESLGSNLLFSSKTLYPMMVVAKTNVSLYSFSSEVILELCKESAVFLSHFLVEVSDKALVLTGKINAIALKSMRDRILEMLRMEQMTQKSDVIILPFSKKEWAELLGVQRPSLSRELNKMRVEGIIKFNNREFSLLRLE
ncbi:MAG: Crp/Fnr family transcriptional regulator [Eubacteriaceae bacterium]